VAEISAIDLVVPTLGRTAELSRFLDSIAAQAWGGSKRVILVDQNSGDRLVPIVDAAGDRLDILHLRSEPGVSRACNVGFRQCTAPVIARADDDCWYSPDTLERVVNAFEEHPEWDAVCGSSCDESGRPTQLRWDKTAGNVSRDNIWRRAIGFTLFVKRPLAESLGDWDESYGPRPSEDGSIRGGSEDGEYLLRIIERGFALGYDPSIRIFHAEATPAVRDRRSMRKAYYYGLDHSRLLRHYGYPRWYPAWRSAQLFAGAGVFLARGEPGRARFYGAMARGRLVGMLRHSHPPRPPRLGP
jgi:glycosyltransferase involved in cell wall biosynthesis